MKLSLTPLLAAALLLSACQIAPTNPNPAATSDVTVNFQEPDKFTDARDSANGPTSEYYVNELGNALKQMAANQLTKGQKLSVTFSDIDLAGDITPGQLSDIRIMKAIYAPRMTLTFKLQDASGAVIKEGARTLMDMNYQQSIPPINQSDPLRYDKALLADWVKREF